MADLLSSSGAETRAADALLRRCGGRAVLLRLPAPATPGDPTEQLGLAAPQFQEVELSPVVLLKQNAKGLRTLLISASAVHQVLGSLGYSAAQVLFRDAAGVVIDDVLLEILSVTEDEARGETYLYRAALQTPAVLKL